jgi:hypothetical protein
MEKIIYGDLLQIFATIFYLAYMAKDQVQLSAFSFNTITAKVLAKKLKERNQHKLLKRLTIDDYPHKIYPINWEPKVDTLTPNHLFPKGLGIELAKKIIRRNSDN